jgi:hypothetical protein
MLTEAEARDLKRRHSATLLKTPGVSGVGVEKAGGGYTVAVYLASADPQTRAHLPADLDGHPYKLVESGPFTKQ